MQAIILLGNQQFLVKENDEIYIEKANYEVDQIFQVTNVLMCNNEVGTPFLKNVVVECQLVKHGLQRKIKIIKHIPQKHHTKTQGHRQKYSKVLIKKITLS